MAESYRLGISFDMRLEDLNLMLMGWLKKYGQVTPLHLWLARPGNDIYGGPWEDDRSKGSTGGVSS